MKPKKHRVTIAGAGPGDPELASLKTIRRIQEADIILYDALINEELLSFAQDHCKFIFVGKRKGKKEFSQDEINKLLLFYAQRYENVLRLKGGDPFVFGRGHEELAFLSAHGIASEIIPGISSSISAPAFAGIPVVKRGVSESFWVITGMLESGKFSSDLYLASQSSATVVILMGMTHLNEILQLFSDQRTPTESAAVISNAWSTDSKIVVGTVSDVSDKVREQGVSNPAVIIIGKVVNERIIEDSLVSIQNTVGCPT